MTMGPSIAHRNSRSSLKSTVLHTQLAAHGTLRVMAWQKRWSGLSKPPLPAIRSILSIALTGDNLYKDYGDSMQTVYRYGGMSPGKRSSVSDNEKICTVHMSTLSHS